MKYIKTELKKLVPISLMLIVFPSNISTGLSLVGLFLLFEHMWSYGRWDIKDILGHENLGILLLLTGLGLVGNWIGFSVSLASYLLFSNYKWKGPLSPIQYAKKKFNLIKFWSKK